MVPVTKWELQLEQCLGCSMRLHSLRLGGVCKRLLGLRLAYGMRCSRQASSMPSTILREHCRICLPLCLVSPDPFVEEDSGLLKQVIWH